MDIEEVKQALISGSVKFHELDKLTNDSNLATRMRREFLEWILNLDLSPLSSSIDFNSVVGRNCENTIGAVQVPVGVAGPLRISGSYAEGDFYIPLATTEGALVASVNRGCAAITESGGARVRVLADRITRAPVVKVTSIEKALELSKWVNENFSKIKQEFEKTTKHGKLIGIEPYIVGNTVFLRFEASSGDAMGMNMLVKGTDKVMSMIVNELPYVQHIALSGNLCTDKKSAAINWIEGRGKTVTAEALVKEDLVREKLKTTPKAIQEVVFRKVFIGSARAGTLGGFNAHAANVVAAIFLATGQDMAQVVESSQCLTTAEVNQNGDLYISVTLPSLEVGTVGGGTGLPSQFKALEIMRVAGSGDPVGTNAIKFAEIVGAAVLAGELSLLAALSAHHLAYAHMKLGRGKKG